MKHVRPTGSIRQWKYWLGLNKTEQATYAMGVADGLDFSPPQPKTPGLFWMHLFFPALQE